MPYVMKYETWKSLTEVPLKPRSKYLKAIDKALGNYEKTKGEAEFRKLKLALHHWKMSKGYDGLAGKPAWVTSDRNRRQAVETLDAQVFGQPRTLSQCSVLADLADLPFYGIEAWAGEAAAKAALKQARTEALHELFFGRKVEFSPRGLAMTVYQMKRRIETAKKRASEAKAAAVAPAKAAARQAVMEAASPVLDPARQTAQELIETILSEFPTEVAEEALKLLGEMIPNFVMEIASCIAPYLSLAPGANKAFRHAAKAVIAEYRWIQADQHMHAMAAGDPAAAAAALLRVIERSRNHQARLAGVYSTDVLVKAGSIAADAVSFGAPSVSAVVTPLQGMATAITVLSLQIFAFGREVYERHKANKILGNASGIKLSAELFDTCPVMGCYFIACSNSSDVVNFLVEDMGLTGWKFDIEVLVKNHVEPLIGYSREFIASSRLVVEGMEMSKGGTKDLTSGPLGLSNLKNRLQKKVLTKIKCAVPFIDDPTDYQVIARKQGHQPVSPDLLRQRIQGSGPKR